MRTYRSHWRNVYHLHLQIQLRKIAKWHLKVIDHAWPYQEDLRCYLLRSKTLHQSKDASWTMLISSWLSLCCFPSLTSNHSYSESLNLGTEYRGRNRQCAGQAVNSYSAQCRVHIFHIHITSLAAMNPPNVCYWHKKQSMSWLSNVCMSFCITAILLTHLDNSKLDLISLQNVGKHIHSLITTTLLTHYLIKIWANWTPHCPTISWRTFTYIYNP